MTYSPTAYAAVPLAQEGLTSVFGMGTGVTPSLSSPGTQFTIHTRQRRFYTNIKGERKQTRYAAHWMGRTILKIFLLETINNEKYGQASRAISTGQLNMLPCVYFQPINLVFSQDPSAVLSNRGIRHLEEGFPLRCFQRLSPPNIATQRVLLAQ